MGKAGGAAGRAGHHPFVEGHPADDFAPRARFARHHLGLGAVRLSAGHDSRSGAGRVAGRKSAAALEEDRAMSNWFGPESRPAPHGYVPPPPRPGWWRRLVKWWWEA